MNNNQKIIEAIKKLYYNVSFCFNQNWEQTIDDEKKPVIINTGCGNIRSNGSKSCSECSSNHKLTGLQYPFK